MVRFAFVGLVALVTTFLFVPVNLAQNNKAKSSQEERDDQGAQNEKQEVKLSQGKLKVEQKELRDAQRALDDAEGLEKAARQRLGEVRKRIEAKYEKSSGLEKALAQQEAAKKSYEEAAAPVLKALKEKPEYQAAAKKVAQADARLKTIREDETLVAAVKLKAIAKASKDMLATSELEQSALEGNASARSARAKLAEAEARVTDIRNKIHNLINADPEIESSRQAMQDAAEATEFAGQKMERIRNKVAADSTKLGRELHQAKQTEAQDKASNTQNKKRK